MRNFFFTVCTWVCFSFWTTVSPGYEYRYGDPTPAEQLHLEAVNRARMNPPAEAARLGIDLSEGISDSLSADPRQPLTFNAFLHQAAKNHSADMIRNQYFSHLSPDGKTPFIRISEAGYPYSSASENLAFHAYQYPANVNSVILQMHDNLFTDKDAPDRVHRQAILEDAYKEIGIGLAEGAFSSYPYSFMLTCDFGSVSEIAFLTGVVYDDKNQNGKYDAGEGLPKIEVGIVNSNEQTRTASAGGYGIPLKPGFYTVRAVLPDAQISERSFTIQDKNIKIDFLTSDFQSGSASLEQAVLILKILCGIADSETYTGQTVGNDGRIGFEELITVLQLIAQLR